MTKSAHLAFGRIIKPAATMVVAVGTGAALAHLSKGAEPGWGLLKLLLALGLMVLMLRENVPVGLALLAGALFLGVSFGLPVAQLWHGFSFGLFAPERGRLHAFGLSAFRVGLMVMLINFLGQALIEGGGIRKLVGSLERLLRDARWVLAAIPAFVGLLPMPGGAMLSAPMVGDMGERLKLNPEQKTLVNYWFRHVWEWWWPLFPAILIVLDDDYFGSMAQVLRYMGFFTVGAILLGWFFILRRIPRPQLPAAAGGYWGEVARVVSVVWPALVVVFTILLIRLPKPYGDWVLPCALVLVDAALVLTLRMNRTQFVATLGKAVQWRMLLLVIGVYVLRGIFAISGAAGRLPHELAAFHLPAMVVCFLVPFLINLITGYNLAGVSMAFPLLAAIFAQETGMAGMAVAYAGAFVGVLSSPVHLCLALTREYFHAEWGRLYYRLTPLLLGLVALAALIGWLG